MPVKLPFDEYPKLTELIDRLDRFLQQEHREFFGPDGKHPILNIKPSKVVHDNLWGTNKFSWAELCLIDSPILQRLRDVHQVGLAFHVYPSARHTRFEHCLGVTTIASRIFDVIAERNRSELMDIMAALGMPDADTAIRRLRQELRLAALLHDTGHSLFSHASERVYQGLNSLTAAQDELKTLAGKKKGAGEVLSFCLASTHSIRGLLDRARRKLSASEVRRGVDDEIDLGNVALMIVGRASHPYLQFLGDIVSSGFDADKLDYLLRDATAAGLPLRYDLDRYLYGVRLEKNFLVDDEDELEKLYGAVSPVPVERQSAQLPQLPRPFYETYRLRIPRTAMNAVEQIIICKMMLFSYLYHHTKVRAAEGLLERFLKRMVQLWRTQEDDKSILERFLRMTDSSLHSAEFVEISDDYVKEYAYRIVHRLLPREVYRLSGDAATHAERPLLTDFLTNLQDNEKREGLISQVEQAMGQELNMLGVGTSAEDALYKAGVWLDVPSPPKFEDIEDLVMRADQGAPDAQFTEVFPVGQWTQAYTHFRYAVRIFSFSEYVTQTEIAAKRAMQKILNIKADSFYKKVRRSRQ
jgi:HD superfamily phosphohydrolase